MAWACGTVVAADAEEEEEDGGGAGTQEEEAASPPLPLLPLPPSPSLLWPLLRPLLLLPLPPPSPSLLWPLLPPSLLVRGVESAGSVLSLSTSIAQAGPLLPPVLEVSVVGGCGWLWMRW